MARIPWRRVTVAALALALLTGCGAKDSPAPASSASPSGDSILGGAPTPSATAAAQPTGGSGSGSGGNSSGANGGANSAPSFPKDPKAYVQELLKAIAKPDYTRIGQLAIQSAAQQIKDSLTAGGVPNAEWPAITCTANTGPNQTTCVVRNTHGDQLTVKLNQLQLGFPTAVTEASLERTTYPTSPADYVNAMLYAYSQGNQQRVVRLSSDAVKAKITCTFGMQILATPIDTTYSKVTVTGVGVDLGKLYVFKVLTAPGGKPNAVKEVQSAQCG